MVDRLDLFSTCTEFPDAHALRRYQTLVGLDETKRRVVAEASALIDPSGLEEWSRKQFATVIPLVAEVRSRTPLIVLCGDVGTGKTELAETVGDAVAREMDASVRLFGLSLTSRGRGAVGEMTTLITAAFEGITVEARKVKAARRKSGLILLIDEADAILQSREADQMHHEDRAGVNAVLRGIDTLRREDLPVLTLICTNRFSALDPALRRRAAAIHVFERPNEQQRNHMFMSLFEGTPLKPEHYETLVRISGPTQDRDYGWTFSDIRQRFASDVLFDAYPQRSIDAERVLSLASTFEPTRPFPQP